MNRCVTGGMALSFVETRDHDGIVLPAGSPERDTNASLENGRCVACIWSVTLSGRSPANASWNADFFMYRSIPVPPPGSGYGRKSSVVGPIWEPGFMVTSWARDSPLSGANAAMKTSAFTFGTPTAALVITAPPEEWATRTIGPEIVCKTLRMYAESEARSRSGLAGAMTG